MGFRKRKATQRTGDGRPLFTNAVDNVRASWEGDKVFLFCDDSEGNRRIWETSYTQACLLNVNLSVCIANMDQTRVE